MNVYGKVKVTSVTRAGMLRWLEHEERAENSRIANRHMIAERKLETRMKNIRGRPRRNWFESVNDDTKKT